MNKDELKKELEELRDIKDYSQSELLNTGYRTAILDSIDLVKKLTIPVVSKSFYCQQGLGVGGKDCDTQCEYCKED